jgi:hypothetical protein
VAVEWYRSNHGNWGSIEAALVPHPRIGMAPQPQTHPSAPSSASDMQVLPPVEVVGEDVDASS